MNPIQAATELIEFTTHSPSSYHAVDSAAALLKEAGFLELPLSRPWNLTPASSYYINAYGTTLFAFTLGRRTEGRLHIAAAHTDYPCLRVKPSPEMQAGSHYLKLNISCYGGAILNTWLDRPLSAAGKVMIKNNTSFTPECRFLDCRRPLFIIPNLAIHMNRDINKGVELNKQVDLLPLAALTKDGGQAADSKKPGTSRFFLDFLAAELHVAAEDILDFDLTLYVTEEGCLLGLNEEFISTPRIDNQTSMLSCISGILKAKEYLEDGINLIALFDNEEVGSSTKQGADSSLLPILLDKLYLTLGIDKLTMQDILLDGFCLSLDVAHGIHPNKPEKCDPTNTPYLGGGIVLKLDPGQRYATDTEAVAMLLQLCEAKDIPYQKFVNRSDMIGGSTLGSITSAHLPMRTVDLGVPILAMHSARELMGAADQSAMNHLVAEFFLL